MEWEIDAEFILLLGGKHQRYFWIRYNNFISKSFRFYRNVDEVSSMLLFQSMRPAARPVHGR